MPYLELLVILSVTTAIQSADGGAATPRSEPERRVIDRVVAVLDGQPLLLSELELEARVNFILHGGTEAAVAPLSPKDLQSALDYAIAQRLAHAEAERLDVFAVDEAQGGAALRQLAAQFSVETEWADFVRRFEATEDQLAAILRRNLRAARFLENRTKRSAFVGDEELRRYFAAHRDAFGDPSFEHARESLRAKLMQERASTFVAQQIKDLRAQADVRILVRFVDDPLAKPDAGASPTKP